jgi:hypothetical protein
MLNSISVPAPAPLQMFNFAQILNFPVRRSQQFRAAKNLIFNVYSFALL